MQQLIKILMLLENLLREIQAEAKSLQADLINLLDVKKDYANCHRCHTQTYFYRQSM